MTESIKTDVYRSQVLDRTFQIFDILANLIKSGVFQVPIQCSGWDLMKNESSVRLIPIQEETRFYSRSHRQEKVRDLLHGFRFRIRCITARFPARQPRWFLSANVNFGFMSAFKPVYILLPAHFTE